MSNQKLVSYSLLAFINSKNGGVKDLNDIFIPLVKKGICSLNNKGITQGESVLEIKNEIEKIFGLDIPVPLLRKFLEKISKDVEGEGGSFKIFKDGAFSMNQYVFADYDEILNQEETNVSQLENLFIKYLIANNLNPQKERSLIEFLDANKISLSRYFAYQDEEIPKDKLFVHVAKFLNEIKSDPHLFKQLRKIYLGSIISTYLEVDFGQSNIPLELVLDTSFVLGLLDLKSPETTHTCIKIHEISARLGFKLSVLPITIQETRQLLRNIASNLSDTYLQRYLDPESIYAACSRRKFNNTDVEEISAKLDRILSKEFGVYLIGNDEKYRNLVKFKYGKRHQHYLDIRETSFSALHDTVAEVYVFEHRHKNPTNFLEASCWFVSNSAKPFNSFKNNKDLPALIRSEDLVNLLWLSNPMVKNQINGQEISDLGLTRLISSTLSNSLPSAKVLRHLDENIQKYAAKTIEVEDCVRAATKIAALSLENIENLNKTADKNPEGFIDAMLDYSNQSKREDEKWRESVNDTVKQIKLEVIKTKKNAEVEKKALTISAKESNKQDLKIAFDQLSMIRDAYEKNANKTGKITFISVVLLPVIPCLIYMIAAQGSALENFLKFSKIGWLIYVLEYLFFAVTNEEWKPQNVLKIIQTFCLKRLINKYRFDEDHFNKLSKSISDLEEEINSLKADLPTQNITSEQLQGK